MIYNINPLMLLPENILTKDQKIIPPIYLMFAFILMITAHCQLPTIEVFSTPISYSGLFVTFGGLFMTVWGMNTFQKAGTAVKPFDESTVLVTSGLFRYSRNPIYLGMLFILIGNGIYLGGLLPFFVIPMFFFIVQECFIKKEEPFLEEIFGEDYRNYKTKVRRWI